MRDFVIRHSNGKKVLIFLVAANLVYLLMMFVTIPRVMVFSTRQLPADMFYPFLSAVAYCLLMAWLLKKFSLSGKPVMILCLVPLLAGLFDYLENFGIIAMIVSYPDFSAALARTSEVFTILKSMFSALSFTVLIFGLMFFLVKTMASWKKKPGVPG